MIESLSAQLELSKKQVRKREHRRIEMQKKLCKRKEYPKCVVCSQPSSANCENESCRNCCKIKCIRGPFTCIGNLVNVMSVHRYSGDLHGSINLGHRFIEDQSLLNKREKHAAGNNTAEEELIPSGSNNCESRAD